MKKHTILSVFFVFVFTVAVGTMTRAAVINVTGTQDGGPGSLRAAILTANANGQDNTVILPAGTYSVNQGDLVIDSPKVITIIGAGANTTIITGCSCNRVFYIESGNVFISGITIKDGITMEGDDDGHGAGIYNKGETTLSNCTIKNNSTGNGYSPGFQFWGHAGGSGGGIFNANILTLTNCSIINNGTGNGGDGGVGGPAGKGGGIYNSGETTLTNCTISKNVTGNGGSGMDLYGDGGSGGGIYNNGTITITNCTITNNKTGNGYATSIDASFAGNGGGITGGTINIKNTIIANNRLGESVMLGMLVGPSPSGPDCFGTLNSMGYNLIESTQGCTITGISTGNITGIDPLLDTLANNGGATQIHALLPGSPAIDAGNSSGISFDQRGYVRPFDIVGSANVSDGSDIGAYEYMSFSVSYSISGKVTDGTNPLPGATIFFSHDGHTETTDADGNYFSAAVYGTTTTITPSKTGYTWNPVKKTFYGIISNVSQNFTGTQKTYLISGTVTDGTNPVEGITITFSHDGHTETTDANGYYSYTAAYGTSTTVTASKPGYTFEPSRYNYSNITGDKPNQDFTALNLISVTITNPQNGGTVSGAVIINADVSTQEASAAEASIQPVAKVEFYVDGALVKEDTRAPYQHRWDTTLVANGNYPVEAKAYHSSGVTSQHTIMVDVSNSTEPPHITLNRTGLNFGAVIGESPSGPQAFMVSNSGGGILDWTVSASESWIQAAPLNGTANGQVHVSVDITGLNTGKYTGTVIVTDTNADNSPVTLDIFLSVNDVGEDLPLIGSIDSPIDGSTVSGSIAVTGWALDDTEISSVKIYRQPIWGEELGLVLIGEAVFIEGARPDIEIQFPEYPKCYRAGWGYVLLTNVLPNDGNGTFMITAIATGGSGNEKVVLGSKTINCDNENSTKPFGTIDTPTQGGNASGMDYVNFGWALTPLPNTIPADGSTINVWVDGVPLTGNPVYNQYRQDVQLFFPGYNNSDGAGGYYYLDTTLYANGIHTISWSVTDDAGNTDGIGSRYFMVMNAGNPYASSIAALGHLDVAAIQNLPVSRTPVYLDKGYNTGTTRKHHRQVLYPGNEDIINIELRENERIEVKLGTRCRGSMLVGGQLRGLPPGSVLDMERGVFYWQPGPGFMGTYRFVFIENEFNGRMNRRKINITIRPND